MGVAKVVCDGSSRKKKKFYSENLSFSSQPGNSGVEQWQGHSAPLALALVGGGFGHRAEPNDLNQTNKKKTCNVTLVRASLASKVLTVGPCVCCSSMRGRIWRRQTFLNLFERSPSSLAMLYVASYSSLTTEGKGGVIPRQWSFIVVLLIVIFIVGTMEWKNSLWSTHTHTTSCPHDNLWNVPPLHNKIKNC